MLLLATPTRFEISFVLPVKAFGANWGPEKGDFSASALGNNTDATGRAR